MSEREPITTELRAALDVDREFMRADGMVVAQTFCVDRDDFERLCDAIDAVHAALERENAELRERLAVLDNGRGNMHDGGSITGELREWASVEVPYKYGHQLTAIADRIDAEHQKAEDEWKAKDGQTWLKGYAECHAELMEGNEVIAESLEKAGWVKLPVDADGEYIHAGDVLDGYGKTIEVVEMRYGRSGWVLISRDGIGYADTFAFSHHHAPTVEDVLVKMLEKAVGYSDAHTTVALNAIAEYAAKLRLAGGGE